MKRFFVIIARILAVAFVVSLFYFTVFYKEDYDRNPEKINPDIYYAFQKIYHDCQTIDFSKRDQDCQVVVDIFNKCQRGELHCPVSEYYQFLYNLGYKLPPFYVND